MVPFGCCWLLRWCFLIILTPSTIARCLAVMTLMTLPRLPRSVPAMTTTSSPFFTWNRRITSNHFRRERDDLHELLVPQLARHGTEDPRATRILFLVDDDNGVRVEAQIRAVAASDRLAGANHHRIHDVAFFHRAVRRRFFDVGLDDVAHLRVALVASKDADGRRAFGAAVIRHVQNGTNLQHIASSAQATVATSWLRSTISTR